MQTEIIKEVVMWILSLAVIVGPAFEQASKDVIYFDESDRYLMVLGNSYYEVGFLKSNGAISYIIDQSTGRSVTEGSRKSCLWSVSFDAFDDQEGHEVGGCDYEVGEPSEFSYSWSDESQTLTLYYESYEQISAEVQVMASAGSWFDMRLQLTHQAKAVVEAVDFPSDLLFKEAEIQQVILPMLPGVALQPAFFEQDRSYVTTYPAPLFADYLSLSSDLGQFALYSLHEETIQPVSLGVTHDESSQESSQEDWMYATHSFQTHIRDGEPWTSPTVRVRISQSPEQSIRAYRVDNRLHHVPSLTNKLDSRYEQLAQAPLIKADAKSLFGQLDAGFDDYADEILAKLPAPAIFHTVAYWEGQFDQNYPDFYPPNATYGTPTDFVAMIEEAQAMNFVVMPYTNPTWWNQESPTLQNLPSSLTVNDLVVRDKEGEFVSKSYGSRDGLVMSPYVPFVQQRLADVIEEMTILVPSDLLFEDQIGARPWLFDYNPSSPSPTAYSEGWLEHTRLYRDKGLMTEGGYDRLAETLVGFYGGILLRERVGITERSWGKETWRPYPLAPLMVRDKVFFYQHNLDSKTMTKDNATLTWNLAFGYMLSHNLSENKYGGGLNSPWLKLVSAFQKEVLAHYADELVTDFVYLNEHVTQTSFETFEVIANWHEQEPYRVGEHTLPPLGVMTRQKDGHLVAGVFTYYNNTSLSDGDHYIIEERQPNQIILRQPMGSETKLSVNLLPTWSNEEPIMAWAYNKKNQKIAQLPISSVSSQYVTFVYQPRLDGQEVAYVVLSLAD